MMEKKAEDEEFDYAKLLDKEAESEKTNLVKEKRYLLNYFVMYVKEQKYYLQLEDSVKIIEQKENKLLLKK